MPFIAGAVDFKGLDDEAKGHFDKVLSMYSQDVLWPLHRIESSTHILVHSGPSEMWVGPRVISTPGYDAISLGTQWRKTPCETRALEYLCSCFLQDREVSNCFDYFQVAIVDRAEARCILATDPLGFGSLIYSFDGESLVFSDHQLFLREYFGPKASVCKEAVLEFLLLHYLLGEKTLLENVKMLGPGERLDFQKNSRNISKYTRVDDTKIDSSIEVDQACELIWNYLDRKFKGYCSIAKKDFAVLLSGGWDSRLIAGFLAKHGRLRETFTTEQGIIFNGKQMQEKQMAEQVAKLLRVKNTHIPQAKTSPKKIRESTHMILRTLDFGTTMHRWASSLLTNLPKDQYVLTDGFMGAITARRHTEDPAVRRLIQSKDKRGYAHLLIEGIFSGRGTIHPVSRLQYPDLESWKQVLDADLLYESLRNIWKTTLKELNEITSENFAVVHRMKTRARRAVIPLATNVIGANGAVVTPFSDPEYMRLIWTLLTDEKQNRLLHVCLLEKTVRGLSRIPSTNTKDMKALRPYLVPFSGTEGLLLFGLVHLPQRLLWRLWSCLSGLYYLFPQVRAIVEEATYSPPTVLRAFLSPKMQKAIETRNRRVLAKYAYQLYGILALERFYSDKSVARRLNGMDDA